jgi:hypothetical protein
MSDESEYLRVQSVYLAPSEPESFTLFALDTQGMTIPEYLAQFNAKAARVLAVTSPQGTLELVPDDTAPEGVALLWNGERRTLAPMSATPEGVDGFDDALKRYRRAWRVIEQHKGTASHRDAAQLDELHQSARALKDAHLAAIAAHVAARVGEERERIVAMVQKMYDATPHKRHADGKLNFEYDSGLHQGMESAYEDVIAALEAVTRGE